MHRIEARRRAAPWLVLLAVACLAGSAIFGAFHHHERLDGTVANIEGPRASETGPCLACRVSEQKASVPVAAAGARLPYVAPGGVAPVRMKLPRSLAVPACPPRSPPAPAFTTV